MKPYQHYYFDNFSKALANKPGGVETNTDSVIQTELAGYLGSSTPKGEFDILEAPDVYWEQVADILGPVVVSWDIPNVAPKDWTQSGRMSYSQWDGFSGLCAHVHVPENDHWDLPVPADALEILQKKLWTGSPQIVVPPPIKVTVPKGDVPPRFPLPSGHVFGPKTGPKWQHSGYYSSSDRNGLRIWQARMRYRGWKIGVDGFYGPETAKIAGQFQAEKHLSVDHLIGINTWNTAWSAPIT
jgi:peptidoglycan hydrolase-like protein with peptidoglycan-binding domain